MLSFESAGQRFHLRVAALLREGDAVLLHRVEGDAFWSLPGGRVDAGETAEAAVRREMREELGVEVVVEGLVAVVENFYAYRGERQHGVELHFAARLPADCPLRREAAFERVEAGGGLAGERPPVRLEFRWFHRDALAALDLRPTCVRGLLEAGPGPGDVRHQVQDDRVPAPAR
jgi:ADP-ribose pyrophosphatase YjhB (NUDIX family)